MSGWLFIGFAVGVITNLIIEFVTKPKRKRYKLRKIQPKIEVFARNYKKFDKVV